MNERGRMKLDGTGEKRRLFCPNSDCVGTKFKFILMELEPIEVEVLAVASAIAIIQLPSGERREFKKGFVETLLCPTCRTVFRPEDAQTTS